MKNANKESDFVNIGNKIIERASKNNTDYFMEMKKIKDFGTSQNLTFSNNSDSQAKNEIKAALNYYPKEAINRLEMY